MTHSTTPDPTALLDLVCGLRERDRAWTAGAAARFDARLDAIERDVLAATAPAAIGTLFVAEVMPYLRQPLTEQAPLLAGVAAVIAVFVWTRSAVAATLAGSLAFGLLTVL